MPCGKIGRWLPSIFVVIIVALIGIGHTHITLNHQYYSPVVAADGITISADPPLPPVSSDYRNVAIFWFIVAMVYYCQYKIIFTNAGSVNRDVIDMLASQPSQPQPGQPTVLRVACFETKANGCRRYCRKCRQWKPDRTHHCYDCGQCTLRLDHHCGFLNNCIGFHNHKYFVLFLLYGATGAAYAAISLLQLQPMQMFRRAPDQLFKMEVMSLLVISAAFAIVLTGFFIIHTLILSNGYTTIEFMEKRDSLKNGKKYSNPYHFGRIASLRGILGKSILKWLIPFSPASPSLRRDPAGGHSFPVNRRHHQQPYPA